MVSGGWDFASIDPSGRLVFRDTTNKGGSKARPSSAQFLTAQELQDRGGKRPTSAKKCQTDLQQLQSLTGDAKPSLPLQTWLDYYQAKGPAEAALEKLEARRSKGSLATSGLWDEEPAGHLDNSMHWLEKLSGAVTLLQEMRQEHIASLKSDSVLPVGRAPSGLLAEWSASEAVDILSEALPQLVDQVALYEDNLAIRGRRNQDEAGLRSEIAQLREEVKVEKRQREYYWRKLRELQQGGALQQQLGIDSLEAGSSSVDNDMPMYTEGDMKALRKQWLAKLEALAQELQEQLAAEKMRAHELELRLRAEISDLQAQLEAMRKQEQEKLDAMRQEWQEKLAAERNRAQELEERLRELNAQLEALQRQMGVRSSDGRSGGNTSGHPSAGGSTLPALGAKAGLVDPKSKHGMGDGQRTHTTDKPSPRSADGLRPGSGSHLSAGQTRTPSSDSAGQAATGSCSQLRGPRETSPAPTALATRPRPLTAPGSNARQEEGGRYVANRYEPGPSESEQRRMTEELKRRVFESVLAEERKRQALQDEEDQNAIAARWELQGQEALAQLVRRVDDQALRRDLFQCLKTYAKRSPAAMEIVCVYCRRKPRPNQIHSFDTHSRPASANRTCTPSASAVNAMAATAPTQAAAPPGTGLPRVSSSPSVITGSNGRLEPRGSLPLKLVGSRPGTAGAGSRMLAPALDQPSGWAATDAAR